MKLCFSLCIFSFSSTGEWAVQQIKLCSFYFFLSAPWVPGQQAAIMKKGLLHVDTSVLQRGHNVAIVKPLQRHWLIQVGGGALQRQAVPTEDQLPLGGDELEEGQLQRSVWNKRKAQKKDGKVIM